MFQNGRNVIRIKYETTDEIFLYGTPDVCEATGTYRVIINQTIKDGEEVSL